jgi:hypothetical protein
MHDLGFYISETELERELIMIFNTTTRPNKLLNLNNIKINGILFWKFCRIKKVYK